MIMFLFSSGWTTCAPRICAGILIVSPRLVVDGVGVSCVVELAFFYMLCGARAPDEVWEMWAATVYAVAAKLCSRQAPMDPRLLRSPEARFALLQERRRVRLEGSNESATSFLLNQVSRQFRRMRRVHRSRMSLGSMAMGVGRKYVLPADTIDKLPQLDMHPAAKLMPVISRAMLGNGFLLRMFAAAEFTTSGGDASHAHVVTSALHAQLGQQRTHERLRGALYSCSSEHHAGKNSMSPSLVGPLALRHAEDVFFFGSGHDRGPAAFCQLRAGD